MAPKTATVFVTFHTDRAVLEIPVTQGVKGESGHAAKPLRVPFPLRDRMPAGQPSMEIHADVR